MRLLNPYRKAMAYPAMIVLPLILLVLLIGVCIPSTGQLALYVSFFLLVALMLTIILIGLLQVRATHKQGQALHWYQQYEIPVALGVLCLLAIFPLIPVFDALMQAHPSRWLYYLEMAVLITCCFLSFFFLNLGSKYRPDWLREE